MHRLNRACLLVCLLVCLLPFSARAGGVLESAEGIWRVDAGNKEHDPGDLVTLKVDGKAKNIVLTYSDGEALDFPYTDAKESGDAVELQMADDFVLRLTMRGSGALSVGEVEGGKLKDVIYFRR